MRLVFRRGGLKNASGRPSRAIIGLLTGCAKVGAEMSFFAGVATLAAVAAGLSVMIGDGFGSKRSDLRRSTCHNWGR